MQNEQKSAWEIGLELMRVKVAWQYGVYTGWCLQEVRRNGAPGCQATAVREVMGRTSLKQPRRHLSQIMVRHCGTVTHCGSASDSPAAAGVSATL